MIPQGAYLSNAPKYLFSLPTPFPLFVFLPPLRSFSSSLFYLLFLLSIYVKFLWPIRSEGYNENQVCTVFNGSLYISLLFVLCYLVFAVSSFSLPSPFLFTPLHFSPPFSFSFYFNLILQIYSQPSWRGERTTRTGLKPNWKPSSSSGLLFL